MGLWFGYLFIRKDSLWPGALAHALNNSWGVVLANWHTPIEAHLPLVYALAALCLAAGYACFHRAGFWPWQQQQALVPAAPAQPERGPQLPYFIPLTPVTPVEPPKE